MDVEVSLAINSEPYYVVSINKGLDGMNQFFEFHLSIRHEDPEKLTLIFLKHNATLNIGELTYECEVVARHYQLITAAKTGGETGQQLQLRLRPLGWETLSHQAMRVFEVSESVDDSLNFSFPAKPSIDELNRLMNLSAFEEDTGFIETTADTLLNVFRLDWWQNQILVQIQETNAEAFSRLVWKMGASFVYNASQADHLWLTIPDLMPVPDNRIVLTEDNLSEFSVHDFVTNRFARWYRDQFTQISHLADSTDSVSINNANRSSIYKQTELKAHFPMSCDMVYDYQPARRDHQKLVFVPIEVNHRYDHRTGYQCECTGQITLNETHIDLSVLDVSPAPFLTPLIATIHSEEIKKSGDRDNQMRYRVRYDYSLTVDGLVTNPKSWLYRLRQGTSYNGGGDYDPLPVGTKVMVQMLNGDREQPVIVSTFVTKHGRSGA